MAVEVATGYVSIVPSLKGFNRDLLAQIDPALADAGAQAGDKVGKGFSQNLQKQLGDTGKKMTQWVTLPLAGVGAAGLMIAADFESSMSQVAQAVGKPGQNLTELSALAKQLGADTQFSAREAADAMVELAKGGFTEAQIQAGALKTAMDLAAAGQMDLKESANLTVSAMGAFGLAAEESAMIADALAGAANASSSDVSDLSQALSQVGASAKQNGMSIQETTAALAAFADAGIKGSDAGTSLKTMLANLQPDNEKTWGAMVKIGEAAGVTFGPSGPFVKANGQMKSMAEIADILNRGLGDMSESQKSATLQTVFGTDAYRAAAVLMDQGAEGVKKYEAATSKMGAAQEAANANLGPTARAMEEAKGAAETAALAIGEALAPAVSSLARMAQRLFGWFSDLPGGVQTTAAAFGVLAAAAGPVLVVTSKMIQAFGVVKAALISERAALIANRIAWLARQAVVGAQVLWAAVTTIAQMTSAWLLNTAALVANKVALVASRAAMMAVRGAIMLWTAAQWALNFALSMNPIGIVIMAIAGLVAAIVVLWNKSETFRTIVIAAWEAIKAAAEVVWNAIKKVIEWVIDAIVWYVKTYIEVVKKVITTAWNVIKAVTEAVWNGIKRVFETVWNAIVWAVKTYINTVKTVIDTAWTAIKTATSAAWGLIQSAIIDPIRAVWQKLSDIIDTLKSNISEAWAAIRTRASEAWGNIKTTIVNKVSDWWSGIRDLITGENGIAGKLAAAWQTIKDKAGETWTAIMSAIKKPIEDAVDWIEGKFKWLIDLKDKFLGGGSGGWGDGWRNDWLSIGQPAPGGSGAYSGNAAGVTKWTGGVGQPGAYFMQQGNWTWNGGRHNGTDVGAGYGTPVFATRPGIVTFAGNTGDWAGNNVQVRLPGGVTLQFAHLSSISARAGQVVGAGSMLGRVGDTGRSFGAHLHVSAIPPGGGTYINPVPFLAQGGIVAPRTGGTLAVLGEAGRHEAVIPLPPRLSSSAGYSALADVLTGRSGGGVTNYWNVTATAVPTEEATMSAWRRWEALQAV